MSKKVVPTSKAKMARAKYANIKKTRKPFSLDEKRTQKKILKDNFGFLSNLASISNYQGNFCTLIGA